MRIALVALALVIGVTALGCEGGKNVEDQSKTSVAQRGDVFDDAQARYPVPRPENFPLRGALVDFTAREDAIDHPWYTYILGQNGNTVGYYVTKTVPISTCNFLSSTQSYTGNDHGNVPLTAPSIDGIFYGGSGASANCGFFFFDYATNAMITLAPGVLFFSVDQPLKLQADPIQVR